MSERWDAGSEMLIVRLEDAVALQAALVTPNPRTPPPPGIQYRAPSSSETFPGTGVGVLFGVSSERKL